MAYQPYHNKDTARQAAMPPTTRFRPAGNIRNNALISVSHLRLVAVETASLN
jgi:hypothetical protein